MVQFFIFFFVLVFGLGLKWSNGLVGCLDGMGWVNEGKGHPMVFFQAEIDITSSVEGIPPIDFRVAPSFFHTCLHSLIGCGEVNCIARGEAPSDLYPIYLPTYLPTFRTYLGTLS